jgi:hypothetical protein
MACGKLGATALLLERHKAGINVRDRIALISRVKGQQRDVSVQLRILSFDGFQIYNMFINKQVMKEACVDSTV